MHSGLSENSWEDPTYNPAKTKSEGAISSSESGSDCTFFYQDSIQKLKQKIVIICIFVVKQYNKQMCGVDVVDRHLGKYTDKMRLKEYYELSRIFFESIYYTLFSVSNIHAFRIFATFGTKG